MSLAKLNRKKHYSLLVFLLGLLTANHVQALSTDKDQPIEVEADSAELDDEKGITIYRGNVIVTQGSMRITGDIMTVTYNENSDLDTLVVEGKPAHYRQMPDNSKVYDEAEALQMDYYALKNYIVLMDNALVKQEGLRFSGNRIEYDTERSIVKAKGKTNTSSGNKDGSDKKDPNARVKIILKPSKK